MMSADFNNKKGFILIASYMVLVSLIILVSGFAARSVGERRVADKERDSVQALWLAEAGIDRAMAQLPSTAPVPGTLGRGAYSAQITPLSSTRFLINSTGGVPAIAISPNNAICKVSAVVELPVSAADPSGITSAITANGDVVVKGSAEVDGDIDDNHVFVFDNVFGISKVIMKNNADHHYVDPPNNIQPVNEVTWIDQQALTEIKITESGWSGSGILVVNGDLTITGGHFTGIIWVIGTLRVSGNPIIDGTIFVESGAEFETTLTGNPTVSYDSDAIAGAFGFIPSGLPPRMINWKED